MKVFRHLRRALAVCWLWALLASVSVANAEPAAADELFQKGRDAAKRRDFAAACAFFSESYALDAAAGTLFNLAHCEEQLRRVATAWTHYRDLAQRLSADDPRMTLVQERLRALEPRLSRLTLELAPGVPEDARVSLDGKSVEPNALGTAIVVDPGNHVLEVTASGRQAKRQELIIGETETRTVKLDAGEPEQAAPAEPPPLLAPEPRPRPSKAPAPVAADEPGPDWQRVAGWGLLGLGAAGLVTSAVAAGFVLDRKSTVEDNCDEDMVCKDAGKDAAESGKFWGTVGTVSFIVGAAAAGGGTVLLLTANGAQSEAFVTFRTRF